MDRDRGARAAAQLIELVVVLVQQVLEALPRRVAAGRAVGAQRRALPADEHDGEDGAEDDDKAEKSDEKAKKSDDKAEKSGSNLTASGTVRVEEWPCSQRGHSQ